MSDDKRSLVANALVVAAMEESSNAFRSRAIKECAKSVLAADPFCDVETARAALSGKVSDKMMTRVESILNGGEDESEEATRARVAMELMTVTCIGQVAARKLVHRGVGSLDELEGAVLEGRASGLGLTAAQELCVRHRKDIALRIPRSEMQEHVSRIQEAASSAGVVAEVVGSYRRNASSSGDIDVLVVGDMDGFLGALFEADYVVGTIAKGGHKFMGLVRSPGKPHARRIDVLCTTAEELPFAMLHFTGPADFNVALRKVAISRGMRLSERGWDSPSAPVPESEADILRYLGVAWTNPQDRSADLAPL